MANIRYGELTGSNDDFSDYDREDYLSGLMFNFLTDGLHDIGTQADADSYLDTRLENIDIKDVFDAYYGLTTNEISNLTRTTRSVQVAGSVNNTNRFIYNMLLHADTIHDFANKDSRVDPFESYFIEHRTSFPNDVTYKMICNEERFIEYLGSKQTLQFGATQVQNPFHNFSIKTFNIVEHIKKHENIDYDTLLQKSMDSVQLKTLQHNRNQLSVDMWFPFISKTGEHKHHTLYIIQLAELCKYIREWFADYTDDNDTYVFQVDGIVFAFNYLIFALTKIN